MPTTKMMRLGEIADQRESVTIEPSASVTEAAKKMARAHKGAVLVVSQGRLRGIFTERDLLMRVVSQELDPTTTPVEQVMTDKLVVGSADDPYQWGLDRMVQAGCRHLPLVSGDRLVGMVSRRDLMAAEIRDLEQELNRVDPSSLFV